MVFQQFYRKVNMIHQSWVVFYDRKSTSIEQNTLDIVKQTIYFTDSIFFKQVSMTLTKEKLNEQV